MINTIYASYDGNVFIPEEDIDLVPNQRYLNQVEIKQEEITNRSN